MFSCHWSHREVEVYKCLFPWPLCHKVSEKGVPMCFLLLITLSGEGAVCCTDSSVRPPGGPWHEAGSTESCVTPLQLLLLLYWTCVLLAEQYTDAKSTSIYNDLPTPPIPQCYLTSQCLLTENVCVHFKYPIRFRGFIEISAGLHIRLMHRLVWKLL